MAETAVAGRKPTTDIGEYLFVHEHQWVEVGAERYPAGTWHPVFQCEVCTDVICDLHVAVGPSSLTTPTSSIPAANAPTPLSTDLEGLGGSPSQDGESAGMEHHSSPAGPSS